MSPQLQIPGLEKYTKQVLYNLPDTKYYLSNLRIFQTDKKAFINKE